MPETISSQNTKLLLAELKQQLGRTAAEIWQAKVLHKEEAALRTIKESGMRAVFKILVSHLGLPPVEFNFAPPATVEQKGTLQKALRENVRYTPQSFAQEFVGFDPNEFVVVASIPFHEMDQYFESPESGIGVTGQSDTRFDLRFLNVSPERLQELTLASLNKGQPVWFAADVNSDVDNSRGIMHPRIFETNFLYGFDHATKGVGDLGRSERLFLKLSAPNHAMAIVGYDQPDPSKPVIKFKVENSWGERVGDRGDYHMYVEWFQKNVYQVIVPRDVLSRSEKRLLRKAPQLVDQEEVF